MAVVDLGSNSFQLLVADFSQGQMRILDRLREMVRLAGGLDKKGHLDRPSQQRAFDCLARFGERLRDIPADRVRVVGTNTLRKAKNPDAFIEYAEELLGHEIDIISGIEEARLIYLGVSHTLPDIDAGQLVIDIGGGSTEIALGEGHESRDLESLYMGCVGISRKFFDDGKLTAKRFKKARTAARLELAPVAPRFRKAGWARAAGASGTIRAAADVLTELGLIRRNITVTSLEQLIELMVQAGRVERLQFAGLVERRAPVFPGGVAILAELMNELGIEELEVTQGALREGVLYDLYGRLSDEDSRERTIRAMQQRYHVDVEQADRVELTALALLDQVAGKWKLDQPFLRLLLGWAARVHEIGLDIAHSQYHRHSAYLLEHTDMPGFHRNEQQLLATIVAAHRRKLSEADLAKRTPKGWYKRSVRLTILLRLAVLFNRSRTYTFPDALRLQAKGRVISLSLTKAWLEQNPLTLADLEQEQGFIRSGEYTLELNAVDELNGD
jgi:exopolyphosphatase/guanosine-5'-triphosphate,3'-diphosphate pyrophosphatase